MFGYSETPISQTANDPLSGYTWSIYGPNFQAIYAQGVGHTVPERATDVLHFFGLDGSVTTPAGPTSTTAAPTTTVGTTTVPTTTSAPTTTAAPGGTVAHWGQCGGQTYTVSFLYNFSSPRRQLSALCVTGSDRLRCAVYLPGAFKVTVRRENYR